MPRGIELRSQTDRCLALLTVAAFCLVGESHVSQPTQAAEGISAAQPEAMPAPPARFLFALDLQGRAHNIGDGDGYRAGGARIPGTECPISREYVPTLNRLAEAQADQPVKFYGVISDPSVSPADALKFQQEFKIEFPMLFDASGEIAEVIGPTHVPEAFVLDVDAQVKYRGRIDDCMASRARSARRRRRTNWPKPSPRSWPIRPS